MSASEKQIVVYQPDETVRLDVRLQKCCHASIPICNEGGCMMEQLETGNIEIGTTSTLATFNKDLGHKCFGFIKIDACEIDRIKEAAFVR